MTGNGETRTSQHILTIFREVRALVHEEVERVESLMRENRGLIDGIRVETIPELKREFDTKLNALDVACQQCKRERIQFESDHDDAIQAEAQAKKHADSLRIKKWKVWTTVIVALIGNAASIILALKALSERP